MPTQQWQGWLGNLPWWQISDGKEPRHVQLLLHRLTPAPPPPLRHPHRPLLLRIVHTCLGMLWFSSLKIVFDQSEKRCRILVVQVWQRNLDLVKSISPRQRVETNTALQVTQESHIGCICLTFLHSWAFSNVFSNRLPVRMQSHIGCIGFLCVFKCVPHFSPLVKG